MIANIVILRHKFLEGEDSMETCIVLTEDSRGRDHAVGFLVYSKPLAQYLYLEFNTYLSNIVVKVKH